MVRYRPVLEYDIGSDSWKWYSGISGEKVKDGMDEDAEAFERFRSILQELGGGQDGETVIREC